jgi:hypothetical protein
MENSHLVQILRTFAKKEIKELRKWVNSPAHNLREDTITLFEYLVAGSHLSMPRFLEKEKIFTHLYPDRTYNDAEMRQVIHFLLKAVEEFLVYKEMEKDEVRTQTLLARVYRQRHLPKLFQKTIEYVKAAQNNQTFHNHQFFENEYLLQFEQYSYLSGLGRDGPLNLQAVSDAHDIAYLANKFRLSCIMLSHQTVYKTDYKFHLVEDLAKHIETNADLLNIPVISLYYHSYKAVSDKSNESHFVNLKEKLVKHGIIFPLEELRVIYLLAINYCIGQINSGKNTYFRESLDLYESGIEKKVFFENGILSRFTFSNAIRAALNLNEFQWVEGFIAEYGKRLDEKYQESYIKFYLARLHFERRNYKEAMKIFAQFDYDDTLMMLHAKTMLLKMYYELDEHNALDSLLESMRTYLQRKKVMGYHRDIYKNLISCVKKLLKAMPGDRAQNQKLRQEIEATDPLMERQWLLAQLDKIS